MIKKEAYPENSWKRHLRHVAFWKKRNEKIRKISDPLERKKVSARSKHDVLVKAPKKYFYQRKGKIFCGGYVLEVLLESRGFGDFPEKHLPRFRRNKVLGAILPRDIEKGIKKAGFKFKRIRTHKKSDKEKISVLRRELKKGHPLALLTSSGYVYDNTNKKYSHKKRFVASHWVGILGYNHEDEIFYVYDPMIPPKNKKRKIPVGNTYRTYKQMLRDMKPTFYTHHWRNLFIAIGKKLRLIKKKK